MKVVPRSHVTPAPAPIRPLVDRTITTTEHSIRPARLPGSVRIQTPVTPVADAQRSSPGVSRNSHPRATWSGSRVPLPRFRVPHGATWTAALATLLGVAGSAIAQQGDIRRVHDPHIIAAEGIYYIFSTGARIPIRRSRDLVRWERIGTVFNETPGWARDEVPGLRGLWAPDISFFNGRYHLYYSASTWGRNRSCIGLAINETLDPASPEYKWVDHGKVIESLPGRDNWNAIDANLVLDERGKPWLAFGSFWSGIKLRRLDWSTGKLHSDTHLYSLAARSSPGAVEAPCIVRRGAYYYLFVSFDYCGRGVESTYKIMVGRSKAVTGPYVDRDGKPMLDGGGTLVLDSRGHVRGPGHNSVLVNGDEHWLVHHYYDADMFGVPTLQIRPLTWDQAGWPVLGEPCRGDGGGATQPASRPAPLDLRPESPKARP
ncbi:MAG: arabinan endo-1,5-alpha-L-arabinosidase [Phycisphaerae bacterium]|nr:arabinan endo-1,5-alpha-L-arabinosidase [Phycisphaerae bacterium]